MTKKGTRRELLRRMATLGTFTTLGATSATVTRAATTGPPRLLYSCDITTERDPLRT
ncbi:hypothetical protein [Haladaptatus sp. W1]|uniref:hypothetical protein n=1 Tax=Haladaptatus sp. W1 TaxID=1897478 RepID=UPI001585F874|nr:hypothetical protein [Haladaptatus sp. W1]